MGLSHDFSNIDFTLSFFFLMGSTSKIHQKKYIYLGKKKSIVNIDPTKMYVALPM